MRPHGAGLGEPDANLAHAEQALQQEVEARVGQRGVAHSRAYALIVATQQRIGVEPLLRGITPQRASHLAVKHLGRGLGQPVGQCLREHALIGVAPQVGLHGRIDRGGKECHPSGHVVVGNLFGPCGRPYKVGQRQAASVGAGCLLPQTRYTANSEHDVVVVGAGAVECRHGMGAVCVVEPLQHPFRIGP